MEGEIGRFQFSLYRLRDATGVCLAQSSAWFPICGAREWHKTDGFREEAIFLQASQRSYRTNVDHLNRSRRQTDEGTPLSTFQYNAESEGTAVLAYLDQQSAAVLHAHGFSEAGEPASPAVRDRVIGAGAYDSLAEAEVASAKAQLREAMQARAFSAEQIDQALERAGEQVYEQPQRCTLISIDDVGVKEQSAERCRKPPPETSPSADSAAKNGTGSRPTVQNTVAHIEQQGRCFLLSGNSLGQVLRFVLAFLLSNDLLAGRLHVFTDGKKSLQNTLLSFFAWHPGFWLVLDWYHVVKKFKEDLSLACRGRELRNQHLRALTPLLWYGLVDQAIAYLAQLPAGDIKDAKAIERLQNYLHRNEQAIPCYALRSLLGLRNASSPVESANNQLTARRQKHKGMSWSAPGSWAMTALSMVVANRCCATWVNEQVIPLRFVEKAA